MNGTNNRVPTRQEGSDKTSSDQRVTSRMVRTETGVETEYRVDGAVVGSVAEVEALLEGSA
jgi:hypothetical protein